MSPDYMPPEIGIPAALVAIGILIVMEIRAR